MSKAQEPKLVIPKYEPPTLDAKVVSSIEDMKAKTNKSLTPLTQKMKSMDEGFAVQEQQARDQAQAAKREKLKRLAEKKEEMYGSQELNQIYDEVDKGATEVVDGQVQVDIDKLAKQKELLQLHMNDLQMKSGLGRQGQLTPVANAVQWEDDDSEITTFAKGIGKFVAPIADKLVNLVDNYLVNPQEDDRVAKFRDPDYQRRMYEYQLQQTQARLDAIAKKEEYAKRNAKYQQQGKAIVDVKGNLGTGVRSTLNAAAKGWVGDFADQVTYGGASPLIDAVTGVSSTEGRALLLQDLMTKKTKAGTQADIPVTDLGESFKDYENSWGNVFANTGYGVVNLMSSLAGGSFGQSAKLADKTVKVAEKGIKVGIEALERNKLIRTAVNELDDAVVKKGLTTELANKAITNKDWLKQTEIFDDVVKNKLIKIKNPKKAEKVIDAHLQIKGNEALRDLLYERAKIAKAVDNPKVFTDIAPEILEQAPGGKGLKTLNKIQQVLDDMYRNDLSINGIAVANATNPLYEIGLAGTRMYLTGLYNSGSMESAEHLAVLGATSNMFGGLFKSAARAYGLRSEAIRKSLEAGDKTLTEQLLLKNQHTQQVLEIIGNDCLGGASQTAVDVVKAMSDPDVKNNVLKEIFKVGFPNLMLAHGAGRKGLEYAGKLNADIAKLNRSINIRTEFNDIVNHTPDVKYADIVTGKIAEKEVTGKIKQERKQAYYDLDVDKQSLNYETVIKKAGDKYGTIKDVNNVTAKELIDTFDALQSKGLLPVEYAKMKKAGSQEILADLPPDTKVVFSSDTTNEVGSPAEYNAETGTITFYNKDLTKLSDVSPDTIFANTAAAIHEETMHAATIAKIKANPDIVEAERNKVAEMYRKYQEEGGVDETGAYKNQIPGIDYALSSNEEFLANMFQGNQKEMFKFINEQTEGKLPKFVESLLKKVGIKGDESQAIRKKLAKAMKDVLPDTANEIYTQPKEELNINLSDLEARSEDLKQKTTNLSTDPKEFVTEALKGINDLGIDITMEDVLPDDIVEYKKVTQEREDEVFNYGLHPDLFAKTESSVDEISDLVVEWNDTMPLSITNADAYNIAKAKTGKGRGEITVDEVKAVLTAMKETMQGSNQDILAEMKEYNDKQRTEREILAYEKSQNEDLEGLDKRAYTALGKANSKEMYMTYSAYNHPDKTKAEISAMAYKDIVKSMTDNIQKKYGEVTKDNEKEIKTIAAREAIKLANSTMKKDISTGELVPFPNMISFENGKEFLKTKIAPNLTLDNKAMLTYVVDKLLDLKPDTQGTQQKAYTEYWKSKAQNKLFNYHIIPDVNNMVIDLSTDSAGKEITPTRKANMLVKLHNVLVNHALTSEAMYKGSKDPSLVTKAAKELMPWLNYRALAEGKTNLDELFTYKTISQEYGNKADNESFFKQQMSKNAEYIKDIVEVATQLYKNKGTNPYEIADEIADEVMNYMPLQQAFDSAFHGVINLTLNHGTNDITPKTSYLDSNGRLVLDQGKLSAKYGKLVVDNNTLKLTDVGMIELINPDLVTNGQINKEVLSQYPDLVLTDKGDLAIRSVNVEPLIKYFEGDVANWFSGVMSKDSKRVDGGMVGIGKLPGLDMLAKLAKGKDNWKYLKTKGTNENQGIFKNAIHRYDEGQMVHPTTPGYNDIKQVIEKIAARGVLLQDGTSIKNADQVYSYKRVPLTFVEGNYTALVNNDGSIKSVVDSQGKVDKDMQEQVMRILAKEFLNTGTLPKEFTAEQPITGKHALTIMGADKPSDHRAGSLAEFKLLGMVPTGRSTFKPRKEAVANYIKAMNEITNANREYFARQLDGEKAMRSMFAELAQGEHISGSKEQLDALDKTLKGFAEMLSENPEQLWYGKTAENLIAEIDNLYHIDENNQRTDLDKAKTEAWLIDNYKLFTGKKTEEGRDQSLLYSLAQRNYNKILNGEVLNGSNALIVNPNFSDVRFNVEAMVGKDTALARTLMEQYVDSNTGNIINGGITLPKDFVTSKNLKPGQKILVARKPSHGPDSVAVMTLIGVTDSNQGVMGDNTIFADSMGMDFDKDSIAITLPDPHILTQERYDALVEYVGDLTSDNVGLLPNVRKMDANGELAEWFQSQGWDITKKQSHNPLSSDAHAKAVGATSGAGAGVALKNNIAMLINNFAKNTTIDKEAGVRRLTIKQGDTELKMHFPLDLDLKTAVSTDAAQLGYDGWGDYNYDPTVAILLPFFDSYTIPTKNGFVTLKSKDIIGNDGNLIAVTKAIKELAGSNKFESADTELKPVTNEHYNTPGSNAQKVLADYDILDFASKLDALDKELGFLDYTNQIKNKAKEGTTQLRTELWKSGLIGKEGPGGFVVRKFYKTLDKKPYNDFAEIPGMVRHDETLNGIRDAIMRNVANFGAQTDNGSKALFLNSAIKKHPSLAIAAARRLPVGTKLPMGGKEVEILGPGSVLINKEPVSFEKFLIDYALTADANDVDTLEQTYSRERTFKQKDAAYYKAQTTLDGLIAAVPLLAKKNNLDISNFAQKGDLRAGNEKDDIMTATIKEIALATFMGEPTKEAYGNDLWKGEKDGSTTKANMRALEAAGINPRIGDKRLEELAIEDFQKTLKEKDQKVISKSITNEAESIYTPAERAKLDAYFDRDNELVAHERVVLPNGTQKIVVFDETTPKLDINYGQNRNKELSNFAERPFTLMTTGDLVYKTVEHAFQAAKVGAIKNPQITREAKEKLYKEIVDAPTPYAAKALGRKLPIQKDLWEKNKYEIMYDLIVQSFEQNPKALALLEATRGSMLTHENMGEWSNRFPSMLMQARNELTPPQSLKETQQEQEQPKIANSNIANKLAPNRQYKGGFDPRGKGTPLGDSKDQAMRLAAQAAIVEIGKDSPSSSLTTWQSYKDQHKHGKTHWSEDDENKLPNTVMLARNGVLKGKPLTNATKELIKDYANQGVKFVVGDMPGVDSQFIDYLDEIGANYTIYHAGDSPRIPSQQNTFGAAPDLFAFSESLWRGQADKPTIDVKGNLILNPSYEPLSKNTGKSFTTDSSIAYGYGRRYSNAPYLIEVDKSFLADMHSLEDESIDAEFRVIANQPIVIPKGKYNVIEPDLSHLNNVHVDDLIRDYIESEGLDNVRDEIVFSGEFSAMTGLNYSPLDVLMDVIQTKLGVSNRTQVLHYIAKKNQDYYNEIGMHLQSTSLFDGGNPGAPFEDNPASQLVHEAEITYAEHLEKYGMSPDLFAKIENVGSGIFDKVETSNKMLLESVKLNGSTKHLADKPITQWTADEMALVSETIVKPQLKTKLRELEKTINPSFWKRITGNFKSSELGAKWTSETTNKVEEELSKVLDGFNYLDAVGHKAKLEGGDQDIRSEMGKAMLMPYLVTKTHEMMNAKGYTDADHYIGTLNIFDQLKYGSHNPMVIAPDFIVNDFNKVYTYGERLDPETGEISLGSIATSSKIKAGQQYIDKRTLVSPMVHISEQQYRFLSDHAQMALVKDQVSNILNNYYNSLDGNVYTDYEIETILPFTQKLLSSQAIQNIFDDYVRPDYVVGYDNMQVLGKVGNQHIDYSKPQEVKGQKDKAFNHLAPTIAEKVLQYAESAVMDENLQSVLTQINAGTIRKALSFYADHKILNGAMAKGIQLITDNIDNLQSKNGVYADVSSYELVKQELYKTIADFEDLQQAGRWNQSPTMTKEFLNNAVALTEMVKETITPETALQVLKRINKLPKGIPSQDMGIAAVDMLTKALNKFTSSEKSNSQVAKLFKDVDLPKEQEIRLTKADVVLIADTLGVDMPVTQLMDIKAMPQTIANTLNHTLGVLGTISKDIFNTTMKDSEYSRSITNTILSEYSGKEFTDATVIKNDANPNRLKEIFDDPSKDIPKGQYVEFLHQFNDKLNSKRGRYLGVVPRTVTIVENGTETTVEKQLIAIHTMDGIKSNIELIDEADIKSMTAQEKVSRGGARAEKRIREAYAAGANELLMQVQNYASEARYEKTDKGTYDAVQTKNKIYSDAAAVTKLFTDGRALAKLSKEEYSKADKIASMLGRFSTSIAYSTFGKGVMEFGTGATGVVGSVFVPSLLAPSIALMGKSIATVGKRIAKLGLDAYTGHAASYYMDSTQADKQAYDSMTYFDRITNRIKQLSGIAYSPKATTESTALEAQSKASITGAISESGANQKVSFLDRKQALKDLELYEKIDNFIAEGYGKPITDLQAKGRENYIAEIEGMGNNVEFIPIGKRGYSLKINGRDYSDIQNAATHWADAAMNAMHATEMQAKLEGITVERATAAATQVLEENRVAMENMLGIELDRDQAMTLSYVDYSVKKAIGAFQKSAKQATPFGKLLTQFSRYSREAAVDQYNLFKYRAPLYEAVKETITDIANKAPNDHRAKFTLDALQQLGLVGENSIMGPVDRLKRRVIGTNITTGIQTLGMLQLSQLLANAINGVMDEDIEDDTTKAFAKGLQSVIPSASSDTMKPFSFIGQSGQYGTAIGHAINGILGTGLLIDDLTTDDKLDGRSIAKHTESLSAMSRATNVGGSMTLGIAADMAAIGLFASIYALTEKGAGFTGYENRNPNFFLRFASKQLAENMNFIPGGHPLGYHLQELINRDTKEKKTGEPTSHGILDLFNQPTQTNTPQKQEAEPVQQSQEERMKEREERMIQRAAEMEQRMLQREAEIDERLRNRNN